MGTVKKSLISYINKRNFYFIKVYSFYRKDILGFLRVKRLYRYKKIIYSILKQKRRYYYLILNFVYKGLKFFNKRYKYKANFLFVKKRLKIFYGFFRDSYIGKLGLLVKRKMGDVVNYFFSIIERRIDVLLYRALYSFSIRYSRNFIYKKLVFVNNKLIKHSKFTVFLGDLVKISSLPVGHFFFRYIQEKSVDAFEKRFFFLFTIRNCFFKWFLFQKYKSMFLYSFNIFSANKYLIRTFHKRRSYKYRNVNDEKILRLVYKFIFFYFRYVVYMLKNFKKNLRKKTYDFKKKMYVKFDCYYSPILLFKFPMILRILQVFNEFFGKYKIRANRKRWIYRLYGLVNLRIRLRKLFFFLKPKWFTRTKIKVYALKAHDNIGAKYYRFWKFSRYAYEYFKRFSRFTLIIKGYPSFLEVNYNIHTFLLVRTPTIKSVYYPFSFDKSMFFNYFKMRSYF